MDGGDLHSAGFRQILSCSACPPGGSLSPNQKPGTQGSGKGSCWKVLSRRPPCMVPGWGTGGVRGGCSPLGQTRSQAFPLAVRADAASARRASLPSSALGAQASLGIPVERHGLSSGD